MPLETLTILARTYLLAEQKDIEVFLFWLMNFNAKFEPNWITFDLKISLKKVTCN